MTRACFGAGAAAGALVLVDVGEESVNVDGVRFANLFAFVASDTSNLADRHNVLAFVVVVATNRMSKVVRNKFN